MIKIEGPLVIIFEWKIDNSVINLQKDKKSKLSSIFLYLKYVKTTNFHRSNFKIQFENVEIDNNVKTLINLIIYHEFNKVLIV